MLWWPGGCREGDCVNEGACVCVFVQGNTALHRASYYGHPGCVALLLRAKANIDLTNDAGLLFTPFFFFFALFYREIGRANV